MARRMRNGKSGSTEGGEVALKNRGPWESVPIKNEKLYRGVQELEGGQARGTWGNHR